MLIARSFFKELKQLKLAAELADEKKQREEEAKKKKKEAAQRKRAELQEKTPGR